MVKESTGFLIIPKRSNNSSGSELLHSTYCGTVKTKAKYRTNSNNAFKKYLCSIIIFCSANLVKMERPKHKTILEPTGFRPPSCGEFGFMGIHIYFYIIIFKHFPYQVLLLLEECQKPVSSSISYRF